MEMFARHLSDDRRFIEAHINNTQARLAKQASYNNDVRQACKKANMLDELAHWTEEKERVTQLLKMRVKQAIADRHLQTTPVGTSRGKIVIGLGEVAQRAALQRAGSSWGPKISTSNYENRAKMHAASRSIRTPSMTSLTPKASFSQSKDSEVTKEPSFANGRIPQIQSSGAEIDQLDSLRR